jgi:flagellar basal-body rod protein FlgB
MSIGLFDGLGDAIQQVLDLRRMQHQLTAANLANADTPNYHEKELPFSEILGKVVDAAERGEPVGSSEIEVRERDPLPGVLDGNSVSAEDEAVKMSSNTVMYDALSAGMSKRLALLRFAASDGKG